MFKKIFLKLLLGVFGAVILTSFSYAAVSQYIVGYVNENQTPINYKMWDTKDSSHIGTGACIYDSTFNVTYGYNDIGNIYSLYGKGDTIVFLVEKNSKFAVSTIVGDTSGYQDILPPVSMQNIPVPTATVATDRVNLTWTAPTVQTGAIVGYNIYRKENVAGSTFAKINTSTITTTSYSDTSGTAGKSYIYAVSIILAGNVETTEKSGSSNAVTYPSGGQPSTSILLDDYDTPAEVDGYYVFAPSEQYNPTKTITSGVGINSTSAMKTTYGANTNAETAYRGWGGYYPSASPKNLSSAGTISFWMKGDGTTNKIKFQMTDKDGSDYAVDEPNGLYVSNTTWQEYKLPISSIKKINTTGEVEGLDTTKITNYGFSFSGTSASTGILIDDVKAIAGSVSAASLQLATDPVNLTQANGYSSSVNITNGGTETLTWIVSETANWLTVTPASGTNNGTIVFTGATEGMAAGSSQTATVTVKSNAGEKAITVNITATTPPTPGPKVISVTPASGAQGTTIALATLEAQDVLFKNAKSIEVGFGTGITHGDVTIVDDTTLTVANVAIASDAIVGSRIVSVTMDGQKITGEVFTVTETIPSYVLDNMEGVLVTPDSYYVTAETIAYTPSKAFSSESHEKAQSLKVAYPFVPDPAKAWRLIGAVLADTRDLSSYNAISFWLKGDGKAHKVKFQLKDADGDNFAMTENDALNIQATTDWKEYIVPISSIGIRVESGSDPVLSNGSLDLKNIDQYQLVFTGTTESTGLYIDYVIATNTSLVGDPFIESIDPKSGVYGREMTFTIKGSNLGVGGEVNVESEGVTTVYKSSVSGSKITAWGQTDIEIKVPPMEIGQKSLSIVRTDTKQSNIITFDVVGQSVAGAGSSYNYPNPFNPLSGEKTKIVFDPQGATTATAYIMDMSSKIVGKLIWTDPGTGVNEIEWDGLSAFSEKLGDGVYLYRVIDSNNKLLGRGKILIINK